MKLTRMMPSALAALLFSMTAFAGTTAPFDQKMFDDLAHTGKPVIISVRAPWCPICKVQVPVEDSVMKSDAFKDVTLMTVDFDSQKDILKELNVSKQSAILVYKSGREVGRSIGDKNKDSIETLMKKAI
ncbi:thioredoxin family protein [Paraburkholderia ginsengisoli]|uniref:Thioredoxin family protein n=1 Tax=Paraburkholderia ginsengisoli TaxID=311231 RepID=A0A7T4N2Z8_9BURK|nr:thioredoxin family protein [Paraburkholderia ginsengisoli]QQC64313.1 thioredoxin family protein [Paraburkholderia ginsengisoli]